MQTYPFEWFANRAERGRWGSVIEDDKYWSDEELINNFYIFYVYTFAWLGLPSPTRMQLEIARYISDRSHPHRLVWSPRGIAKSLTSQIYVVWRLLNDPDEHILILSQSSTRAKHYTQFVKRLIALLPITRIMSPRNNIERTSSASFDVVGATPSDSPSIYASGVGNQITGMRATLLIIDDVETSITVQSQALMEKTQNGVDEAHNLLMSGRDESITLATPHSQNSIYLNWLETGTHAFICPARYPSDESVYMGFLAPFIKERLQKDPNLVGRAIDERLDETFLRNKELKIGKSKFKLQFLCDVSESDALRYPLKLSDFIVTDVSDEDAPIKIGYSSMPDKRIYIKHNGFKKDKLYMPLYESKERLPYNRKILSVDPSGTGEDKVGIAILYTLNTKIFIKKVVGLDGGYSDETMANISDLCRLHNIDTVVVESNFGAGSYTKILESKLPKGIAIEEIRVGGQKEVRIIDTIEPLLNQHRLIIDKETLEKDSNAVIKHSFTYQLSHITRERDSLRHDDILDALANGISYLVEDLHINEEFDERKIEEEIAKENYNATIEVFRDFYFQERYAELVF